MILHVLSILPCIPKGQVTTYGDLAKFLGVPKNARQVGRLAGGNPLPLICPCYRVVGNDGRLVGYSAKGGIVTKGNLLKKDGIEVKQHKVVHLSKVRWNPTWHSYFLATGLDEINRGVFKKAIGKVKKILGKDSGSVSFQSAETPHVTLRYLGDMRFPDLAGVVAKMRKFELVESGKLAVGRGERETVALTGVDFFGSPKVRNVGFLKSSHNKKDLLQLQARLMAHLRIKQSEPFVPHLTLFRVKDQRVFTRYEKAITKALEGIALNVSPDQVTLYGAVGKSTQVPLVTFPLR